MSELFYLLLYVSPLKHDTFSLQNWEYSREECMAL